MTQIPNLVMSLCYMVLVVLEKANWLSNSCMIARLATGMLQWVYLLLGLATYQISFQLLRDLLY